jgi:predicted DNA-binding protein
MVTEQGKYSVKGAQKKAFRLTFAKRCLLCDTKSYKTWKTHMPPASPTMSFRLPEEHRAKLDRLIKTTRRSRNFLVRDALERYFDEMLPDETPSEAPKRRLTTLLALGGDGTSKHHVRSREEIDAHIRWLRGDG